MKSLVLLVALWTGGASAMPLPSPLTFWGSFESVDATGPDCEAYFSVPDYQVKHFLVGANRRTSVVHFDSADEKAPLRGLSLVGLLGPDNDIRVERVRKVKDQEISFLADGLVSRDFIILDLKVKIFDRTKKTTCDATAEFSGFIPKSVSP